MYGAAALIANNAARTNKRPKEPLNKFLGLPPGARRSLAGWGTPFGNRLATGIYVPIAYPMYSTAQYELQHSYYSDDLPLKGGNR